MGLNKYLLNTTYILQFFSFGFLYFFPLPPTSKQKKTKSKKKKNLSQTLPIIQHAICIFLFHMITMYLKCMQFFVK